MKELIISLVLACTVLILVCVNAMYINNVTEQLQDLATKAKDSASAEALSELLEHWDTKKEILSLSAKLSDIDSITENLLSLKVAIEEQDPLRTDQCYVLFCNALEDIRRFEKLSFGIIF